MQSVVIRAAIETDSSKIWDILEPVIRAGETYALPRNLTMQQALAYWSAAGNQTFVAELDGWIAGTYYLRVNQLGGGAHVANCGYATSQAVTGRGIARAMCLHSVETAKAQGFRAMQFNFVVTTNDRALRLWRSLGFETAGRLPGAFEHPSEGYVDALVMFRTLVE